MRKNLLLLSILMIASSAHLGLASDLPEGVTVGKLQVLEDPKGNFNIYEVLLLPERFRDVLARTPNYNFTSSAYWFHIWVKNQQTRPMKLYLEVGHPLLDTLTFYVVDSGDVVQTLYSGDRIPASRRHLPNAIDLVLPFHISANGSIELYLRVRTEASSMLVPIQVTDQVELEKSTSFDWVLHGMILGLFGGLFVYNLLLYLMLRRRSYLYYVLYLPFAYLATAVLDGFGAAFIWPWNTWLGNEGLMFFSGIAFVLILSFTAEFLHTREHPRLDRGIKFLFWVSVFLTVSPFFLPVGTTYQIGLVFIFTDPVICFAVGFSIWRRGRTEARFYLIGQAGAWIGLIVFGLLISGVLPFGHVTYESIAIGICVDAVMLSLALADHVRITQRARILAEDMARKNLEIRGEELERLVAERTAEIKTLHGVLPICSNCKKIRNDAGAWQQLEAYIADHSDAQFTHGICRDCFKLLYPEEYKRTHAGTH